MGQSEATPLDTINTAAAEMCERAHDTDTAEAAFGLMALDSAAAQVAHFTREAVAQMRSNGATWARIGAALGTTRSAAQQRFRDLSEFDSQ
jgi:hypothetical protein